MQRFDPKTRTALIRRLSRAEQYTAQALVDLGFVVSYDLCDGRVLFRLEGHDGFAIADRLTFAEAAIAARVAKAAVKQAEPATEHAYIKVVTAGQTLHLELMANDDDMDGMRLVECIQRVPVWQGDRGLSCEWADVKDSGGNYEILHCSDHDGTNPRFTIPDAD